MQITVVRHATFILLTGKIQKRETGPLHGLQPVRDAVLWGSSSSLAEEPCRYLTYAYVTFKSEVVVEVPAPLGGISVNSFTAIGMMSPLVRVNVKVPVM
jgi:hypothetical protein